MSFRSVLRPRAGERAVLASIAPRSSCSLPAGSLRHTRSVVAAVTPSPLSVSHIPLSRRGLAYRPDPTPDEKAASSTVVTPDEPDLPDVERARLTTIADVLPRYQRDGRTFTCLATAPLFDAVRTMVSSKVGCLVAMADDGEHVAGLITERDLLSEMVALELGGRAGSASEAASWLAHPVSHAMTPSREMVHIKLTDTVEAALALMTSQGFRHLPVLESVGGSAHLLRGIVSMRNLVDTVYLPRRAGGKAQFLQEILPRIGVPKNTSIRHRRQAPNTTATAAATVDESDEASTCGLFLNTAVSARPHPDKKHGEDAFVAFLGHAATAASAAFSTASSTGGHPLSVVGVFDGVGSWSFEKNIDPARFSGECARALKEWVDTHTSAAQTSTTAATATTVDAVNPAPLSPISMMNAAWKSVTSSRIVGSSTACILSLVGDGASELRGANIGDSGFLVLRRRDAQRRVGSVGHQRGTAAYEVVFRSPQQLHWFNCPLQLGVNVDGESDKFESPLDADLLVVPVQPGDLVVLATDGLFDNVPEETIIATIGRTMEKVEADANTATSPNAFSSYSLMSGASTTATSSPLQSVADALVKTAFDLSIDKTIDSPFAVLAKDNNILWCEIRTLWTRVEEGGCVHFRPTRACSHASPAIPFASAPCSAAAATPVASLLLVWFSFLRKNGGRKDDITVIVSRVDVVPRT